MEAFVCNTCVKGPNPILLSGADSPVPMEWMLHPAMGRAVMEVSSSRECLFPSGLHMALLALAGWIGLDPKLLPRNFQAAYQAISLFLSNEQGWGWPCCRTVFLRLTY